MATKDAAVICFAPTVPAVAPDVVMLADARCRVHACLCSSLTSPFSYIGNIHFTRLWDPSGISKPNKASVGVSGLAGVTAWLSKRT